jgi:hypothetical protein
VQRQAVREEGAASPYFGASAAQPLSDELRLEVFAPSDEDPRASSRAEFVARAVVAGGGLVVGGVLVAGLSPGSPSRLPYCSRTSGRPSTQTRFRKASSAAICSRTSPIRPWSRASAWRLPQGSSGRQGGAEAQIRRYDIRSEEVHGASRLSMPPGCASLRRDAGALTDWPAGDSSESTGRTRPTFSQAASRTGASDSATRTSSS